MSCGAPTFTWETALHTLTSPARAGKLRATDEAFVLRMQGKRDAQASVPLRELLSEGERRRLLNIWQING